MGFVVKKVPFGSKVVRGWAGPIIGISKSFDAGAKKGKFSPEINGSLPDDSADVFGWGDQDGRW